MAQTVDNRVQRGQIGIIRKLRRCRPQVRHRLRQFADIVVAHGEQGRIRALADKVEHHGALEIGQGQGVGDDRHGITAVRIGRGREIVEQQPRLAQRRRLEIEALQKAGKSFHSGALIPSRPHSRADAGPAP